MLYRKLFDVIMYTSWYKKTTRCYNTRLQLCIVICWYKSPADACPGYIIELLQTCVAKQCCFLLEAKFSLRGTVCDLDPVLEHLEALLTRVWEKRSRKRQTKAIS